MKLLLTMNIPYTRVSGGANKSNRSLAEELASRHHCVRVVVPALTASSLLTHEEFLEELVGQGISVNSNGGIDVFSLNGVEVHAVVDPSQLRSHLEDQIFSFEPDWTLVSSEDSSQNLLAAALAACPSRVVYLAHTPQMFPFGPASLYPGNARTELVGRAIAIVTISKFVADYIRQWTGFQAFVNHPPHFGSGPFSNFGRFDDGYVLMMNACAVKGLSIFIALARTLPHIEFAALPGYGTTKADRAALGQLPNVTLLNNRKNIDDILSQSRVLLMPSLWIEGFGMAVVDAMIRGIPVLASNLGGLVEAKLGTDYLLPVRPIEHFKERLDDNEIMIRVPVVPDQEINPWRDSLQGLLSDRALYERQSRAARDAASSFVNSLSVAPLEEFLINLAAKPGSDHGQLASKLPDPHLQEVDREKTEMIQQITNLTPERRSLLILLLKRDASPDLPILAVSRNQELPLSFSQQRLWFLDQLEPGSASYNVSEALRLKGPLNATALEQSVNEIVRRHEALRTTFASGERGPVQIISQTQPIRLTVVDLGNLHQNEREAQLTALVTREVQRPFDLARGPLFRATLLRLNEQEHILLLMLHHAVVDEWSIGILYEEMGALYEAFCAGQSSPLPELPIQYPDYAVWQREWLRGEVLEELLAYWRERLRGVLPVMELPADRPRPAVQTYRGARQSFVLSKDLAKGLAALSRQEGVTLFMTLLAAFQTLLSRYTKQDDIIVGTDVANRTRIETERLIGFFVNILVMRTDLSGNPTFRELLGRVREVALGAYAHQDLPFEKLVEELRPERDVRRNPLVQVLFVMQNAPRQSLKLPGLTTRSFEISSETSRFDLALFVTEADQSLTGSWVYSTDLFERATVEQMSGHFETLLRSIVAQPNAKLNTLEMLTESEKAQETIQGRRHQEAQIEKLRSTRRKTVLFKQ